MGQKIHIIFHYDAGPALERKLAELSGDDYDIAVCGEANDARFAELMTEAEVLWHCLRPVSEKEFAGAPKLRLIQKIGVGVNTIDLEAARKRDIRVCNMPGTNTRAVAEITLGLMLASMRRLLDFDRAVRNGQGWSMDPAIQDHLGEICGRTVGLVGFGAIPQMLAPILQALGARILYTSRNPKPEAANLAEWRSLPALLAESDIVSLHVPLTSETENMLDHGAIARMKPGAVLINTARGGLVEEKALLAALQNGKLRAAGLDVFAVEPVSSGNPLLQLKNVVLAPHIAWFSAETIDRSLEVALDNCRRLVVGEKLRHQVV